MRDSWHDRKTNRQFGCRHCNEGGSGGHYYCHEGGKPCQDCTDDALWTQENIDAGYGPMGEDTGYDY